MKLIPVDKKLGRRFCSSIYRDVKEVVTGDAWNFVADTLWFTIEQRVGNIWHQIQIVSKYDT